MQKPAFRYTVPDARSPSLIFHDLQTLIVLLYHYCDSTNYHFCCKNLLYNDMIHFDG